VLITLSVMKCSANRAPTRAASPCIDDRALVNIDFAYRPPDGTWTAALYGQNVTDERYDNARLNTGDYVLVILSNDASEFGVRFTKDF